MRNSRGKRAISVRGTEGLQYVPLRVDPTFGTALFIRERALLGILGEGEGGLVIYFQRAEEQALNLRDLRENY